MPHLFKISLIITVKNESCTIASLLSSIHSQTLAPDEVIFSDAGSTDDTVRIIESFSPLIKNLHVIKVIGKNRSVGRNTAITKAKHEIIAVTDAGCVLKNDWLAKITHPIIKGEGDAVAGFYLTEDDSLLARCAAPFLAVMPDALDAQSYLPSSRSIAFTKKAWELAGKYPPHANYCEDLLFAKNLEDKCELIIQPKAIVYWQHFHGLVSFARQIRHYAQGDVEANYTPHLLKIATVYARYLVFIFMPLLFMVYFVWPINKHYRYVRHPSAIIYLPLLQIITDLSIMSGSLSGFLVLFRSAKKARK